MQFDYHFPMLGIEFMDLKSGAYWDERGWTVNPVPVEMLIKKDFGHLHITSAVPGAIRGNHYHKKVNEFLFVFGGEYDFYSEHDNDVLSRHFSQNEFVGIKIDAGFSHALRNTGNTVLYIVSYYDDHYDLANPDTTRELLI